MSHFNWPIFIVLFIVLVIPNLILLVCILREPEPNSHKYSVRLGPRNASLKFKTHDHGRTWCDENGWQLEASPMTDGLQDEYDRRYRPGSL